MATNLRRMLKFGAVGCSGMVVNLVVVGLAFEVVFAQLADGPRHAAAFAAGIGLSIVSNFLLNDCWTWRDRRPSHRGAAARWLRFSAVSLVAAALQFGIAMTLSVGMGWGYMVAQTVGIGVASIVNFVTNDLWTFGAGRGTCAGSGAGGGTRAGDRAT